MPERQTRPRLVRRAVLALLVGLSATADPKPPAEPAQPATERLTYRLRWGVFSAGSAVLQTTRAETHEGQDAVKVTLAIRSNAFIDRIYKVRTTIQTWLAPDLGRTLLYAKNQREGRRKREIRVAFDWETSTAQYSNFGETRPAISVSEGTRDPLGAMAAFRKDDLAGRKDVSYSITDGKKCMEGIGHITKRQKVNVPAGRFDSFILEPDLAEIGGVFEKSPNAKLQIWFSADAQRRPLRIASKVIVGHFVAELIEIEESPEAAPAPAQEKTK